MKEEMPERCRITMQNYERLKIRKEATSDESYGANGVFYLPRMGKVLGAYFFCIVSSCSGWEHLSVTIPSEKRCPTWDEMCHIKKLFWNDDECAVQYHPAETEYVNNHKYCLHLWKPIGVELLYLIN